MTIVQGWEAQAWQKRPAASPIIPAMSASRKSASNNARILAREDYTVSRSPKGARFFLGKYLCVKAPDGYSEGIIIETEAYGGARDKACHAFGNKRTPRTEILFYVGGVAYVYLCSQALATQLENGIMAPLASSPNLKARTGVFAINGNDTFGV
jgi:hypothetical protein